MKISSDTIALFKHFSTINPGIIIEPGNEVITQSSVSTMIAHAVLNEEFEHSFVTSQLDKFIRVSALIDDPEYEFEDDCVRIRSNNGRSKLVFYQSSRELVDQHNRLPKKIEDADASFELKSAQIKKYEETLRLFGHNDIDFVISSGLVAYNIIDTKVKSGDSFSEEICQLDDTSITSRYRFSKRNLNLMSEYDYDVDFYNMGLAKFTAKNSKFKLLEFYVVCSTDFDDDEE